VIEERTLGVGGSLRRKRSIDRIGSGLTLALFGVSPWVWSVVLWIATSPLKRVTRRSLGALQVAVPTAALLGCVALLTALVVGLLAHRSHRRARRTQQSAGIDAPARADRTGVATTAARVATWLAIGTVWGVFGAALMAPLLPYGEFAVEAWPGHLKVGVAVGVMTAIATVAGAARILRKPAAS